MSTLLRGNRDLIKAMNRNLLLNIIRREGVVTRKQLTDVSGLSVGAVSQIITELIQQSWLLEQVDHENTGGRPRTMLRLNPAAGYALGLKLMENRVVAAITNFETEILYYQDYPLGFDDNPRNLSERLASVVTTAMDEAKIEKQKLFGVGIGLAGVIYAKTGMVHHSPYFGWRDVPLAELVQAQLDLPTYVENDVNTLTITEQLFGSGRDSNNFIVVTVGRGIGMGMVINGQLYSGAVGGAGEMGHNILSYVNSTPKTLEELASDPAVVAATAGAATLTDVIERAEQGDEQARKALFDSGVALGLGLANTVNILAPELVIISGEGIIAGSLRLEPMIASLKQHTFDSLLDHVKIVIEPTDDRAWARGAASVVINKVFESPMIEARVEA